MIYCELMVGDKVISTNEYFFQPYKNLTLPTPQISIDAVKVRNGYKLTVSADKFAKAVYLSSRIEGFFSDNYFDLFPGKPVELDFRTRVNSPVEEFRNQVKVRSLKDAFAGGNPSATNK